MASVRLFIAADLGADLKQQLVACQRHLRDGFPDVKWVHAEAMHLTLQFLGDTPRERLDELCLAVVPAAAGATPLTCTVRGVGVFPGVRRPAVVWAGISSGGAALGQLAVRVRDGLAAAGFVTDPRPFSAHITLGRVRQNARVSPRAVEDVLKRWEEHDFGRMAVDQLTLYASTLTPSGPLYESLRTWPLGRS